MSKKNKILMAVLGLVVVVFAVVAVPLLTEDEQNVTVDPASFPVDALAERVEKNETITVVPDAPSNPIPNVSAPVSNNSHVETDATLNVEQKSQVAVDLTDSKKKPAATPPPEPSQKEQQAASESNKPIVSDPSSNQPQTGDASSGSVYLEGFGWIQDEGGGTVQEEIYSDGDINKQIGNMG